MAKLITPLIVALVGALLFGVGSASTSLADDHQVALGLSEPSWYCLGSVANAAPACNNSDALDTQTTRFGRTPAIWSLWSDWGDPNSGPFPTTLANSLKDRGVVPQIYWQPDDPTYTTDCAHWQLSTIINGSHDAYIRSWAQAAKAYGGTIILRFADEMNGNWYIWGNGRCTNTSKKFRRAWRHVWSIFRGTGGVGATNVKFEFAPYADKYAKSDYPGDKVVDYLGLTALNWGRYHHKPF